MAYGYRQGPGYNAKGHFVGQGVTWGPVQETSFQGSRPRIDFNGRSDRGAELYQERVQTALSHVIDRVTIEVPGNTPSNNSVPAYGGVSDCVFVVNASGTISVSLGRRKWKVDHFGKASFKKAVANRVLESECSSCAFGLLAVALFPDGSNLVWTITKYQQLLIPPQGNPFSLVFGINDNEPIANTGAFTVEVARCRA